MNSNRIIYLNNNLSRINMKKWKALGLDDKFNDFKKNMEE